MKKIWIAKVETEDCEEYYLAFEKKPTENKIKKLFFEQHGVNYQEEDWEVCISHDIFEVKIIK